MPTIVEIPEIGTVEFPDGMSEAQIGAEAERLHTGATLRKELKGEQRKGAALGVMTGAAEIASPMAEGALDALSFSPSRILGTFERGIEGTAGVIAGHPVEPFMPRVSEELVKPITGRQIPEIPTTKETPVAGQIAAGLGNAVIELANFMQTPEGIGFLGIGKLPQQVQKTITASMAGTMAAEYPHETDAALEAIRAGDYAEATKKIVSIPAMTTLLTKHAAGSTQLPVVRRPAAELGERLAKELDKAELEVPPEGTAGSMLAEPIIKEANVPDRTVRRPDPGESGRTPGAIEVAEGTGGATGPAPVPESFATVVAQFDLLRAGKRRAVLVTEGELIPDLPPGTATLETKEGLWVYKPEAVTPDEIKAASADNRVGEILGYGREMKPEPGTEIGVVTARNAEGTPVQDVATSAETLPQVVKAAEKAAGPESSVELRPAEKVIDERLAKAPPKAESAPGETITGPDERRGSAMPAEAAAPGAAAARPGSAAPLKPRRPLDRSWDIIDDIESQYGGKLSIDSARKMIEGYRPTGAARKLYSKHGAGLDDVLAALHREGLYRRIETDAQLVEAIQSAAEARKAARKGTPESRLLKLEEKQADNFAKAQSKPPKGAESIDVTNLFEGDEFSIAGTRVRVKGIEFDDNAEVSFVELEDGRRFGTQRVFPGEQVKVDAGSAKLAERSTEFVPEEPKPDFNLDPAESVAEQKAREQREEAARTAREQREEMDRRASERLQGGTGDLGQKDMFGGEDLFALRESASESVYGKSFDKLNEAEQRQVQELLRFESATPEVQGREQPGATPRGEPAPARKQAKPRAGASGKQVPLQDIPPDRASALADALWQKRDSLIAERELWRAELNQWSPRHETYRRALANEQYLSGQIDQIERVYQNFTDPTRGVHAMPGTRVTGQELPPAAESGSGGPRRRPPPPDDPAFTAFPIDLPEAVRFARDLLGGKYPKVVEKLRVLGGRALGVFRATKEMPGTGRIELRADIADLLTREDKARLAREAQEYAERVAEAGDNVDRIARERYEFLEKQAYDEAKTRPPVLALKVLWHEIGHAVDFLPEGIIEGRGNLFGRIAGLKRYLKHTLPRDPTKPAGKPLTPKERAELRAEAEAFLREEMGPIREIVETIVVEEPELRIAGVTPDMIKRLFTTNTAREDFPTLYKWFAEQTAEVKKEIIRKAMKGALDERLKAMGEAQVVGTKKVTKTVRSKVGREPTPAEIEARFRQLFEEELRRRNLAQLATVKAELEGAIAWWRGTEKMEEYFKTSEEMFAEAYSIFLNNPAALQQRAPTFSRLLWNYMDRKPEAKKLYDGIQNEIKSGQAADITEKQMLDAWDRIDAESIEKARDGTKSSARDVLDNVQYHFDRRMGPIYRAVKGDARTREAVGNYLYRASEHELFLNRMNNRVGQTLVDAGVDWKDLGRFMFYKRVIEERYKIFNPWGIAPDRALNRLANMRQSMGESQWRALEQAHANFRTLYEQHVATLLRRAGMFGEELQRLIDDNVYYATFDVVKDKPRNQIENLISQSVGSNVGPHIYRQVGTVREIKNPATATVLKSLSLISAAYRNLAKRETVRGLLEHDPGNITEAQRRWTGKRWEFIERETDTVGTVVFMQEGKPQAYYVRKVVADALNHSNSIDNLALRTAVRVSNGLKGLFTQLNYAFWPVNFVRDSMGWIMQLPGATPVSWAREFPRAMAAARASVKGRPNAAAEAALARKMVISRADPRGVWAAAENQYEVKLASYGLNPAQWAKEADRVHTIVRAWNTYRELGQSFERVNKIAAMNYLDRKFPTMPEWKKREIVRERGGSPDFLQRGAANPYVDFFMMFYNPWKESVRSVAKSARENPWSFGAKTAGFIITPTVLQSLASSGAFGDDVEEMMRSVPDYDLSNYLVVPMGWQDRQQKTVAYLRLPLWEPARILHGSLWQTITGRGKGFLSFWGGTVPSMNSLLNVVHDWAQFEIFGNNPYDAFRGQHVLDDTTFEAGGWPARKELLKQSWNSLGGAIVHRFRNKQLESPPDTEMQKFLALPVVNNALGRWVKVSNRGLADEARRITEPIERELAQIRVAVREIIRKVNDGEALTEAERVVFREPYALEYFMRTYPEVAENRAHPVLRLLNQAPSKASKAAILTNEVQRALEKQ